MSQYIFIIYGSVTIGAGVLVLFALPDAPSKAWFFTPEEKELIKIRLASNQTGTESKKVGDSIYFAISVMLTVIQKFSGHQILEALKDPKCYCIWAGVMGYALANAGITNFNPLIISGYGFSRTKTVLMATPQAAVAMVAGVILTSISLYVPNLRCVFWVSSSIVGLVGALMVKLLDISAHRDTSLAGVYIMGFYNVPWIFMLSLSSSNTAGATKKSFMGVSIAVIYGKSPHCNTVPSNLLVANPCPSNRQYRWASIFPHQPVSDILARHWNDGVCV